LEQPSVFVNAQIRPRVQGYLLKQNYKDGAAVTKGQLLFQIDDRDYKAALDQALGNLAQQQANLKKISSTWPVTNLSPPRAPSAGRNTTILFRQRARARPKSNQPAPPLKTQSSTLVGLKYFRLSTASLG